MPFEIGDELQRRGGGDVLMKPVDIQSPMDVVALIWNKEELFIAMIETPDALCALAEKVRHLMVAFFDEWFGRYGTTFVAHYPDYVMQGGITMSVDEVGAVSDEMFCSFFRDELVAISEHFGGIGIHCCADARHQWSNFSDIPGLKLINHNSPPRREASEYIPDSLRSYGGKVARCRSAGPRRARLNPGHHSSPMAREWYSMSRLKTRLMLPLSPSACRRFVNSRDLRSFSRPTCLRATPYCRACVLSPDLLMCRQG